MSLTPKTNIKVEHREKTLYNECTPTDRKEGFLCSIRIIHIYLELPRREHACPACGAVTERVHDYRMQTIKDVKYFVCDMNPHFRRVGRICFKNAVIVADRYHVIRQVYWAMERVRKNEQEKLSDSFRKYFKKSRYLLAKSIDRLSDEEADRLALMLEIAPRLADAYRLKNEFLAVIRSDSSAVGRKRLADWLMAVEVMELPEFDSCTKAYRNWFQEILNSMDVPWSNGFIEGCNNKTKVLKRVCFGISNFRNFRVVSRVMRKIDFGLW